MTVLDQAIRDDPGAWWETHGSIVLKSGDVIDPPDLLLNYLQRRANEVIARLVALGLPIRLMQLKPRQKGSTTFSGACLYHWMRRRRTSGCVIGGEYSQTKNAWEIIQHYFKKDRFDWKNHGTINTEEGKFSNGSRLVPETAMDFNAGRSGTFQFLIATEVARWARKGVREAKKVLSGILKCVPGLPNTVVILESTAGGAAGDFYERWLGAIDAEEFLAGRTIQPGDYIRIFAAWFEFEDSAIRLTAEQKRAIEETVDGEDWYQGERELIELYANSDLGFNRLGTSVTTFDMWEQLAWRRQAIKNECEKDPEVFDEDYPHSWETAFLKSGRRRFNSAGLKRLEKKAPQRPPIYGVLDRQENAKSVTWRTTTKGEARMIVFEKPVHGRRYLLCADTMTGASQVSGADPDCHSPFVLRQGYFESGRGWVPPAAVARIMPGCRWDIDILEEQLWRLALYYGGRAGCKIVPEINMDRGLVELLKLRGANIYQREIFNRTEEKMMDAYGWHTNTSTREMILENLARAIREQGTDGEGLDLWCTAAIAQLKNFITKDSGRSEAAEGWHDDDVLSLAIGLTCIGDATLLSPEIVDRPLPPDLARAAMLAAQGGGLSQFS